MRVGMLMRVFAIALMMSLVAVAEGRAAALGFYGALRLGGTETPAMTFADPSTASLSLNPKTGWNLEGAVGYHFSDVLRAELAVGYGMSNLSGRFQENVVTIAACGNTPNFPCLTPDVTGEAKTLSAFGMGYFAPPIGILFQPYIGAGIGVVRADVFAHTRATLNNGMVSRYAVIDADNSVMAYRGKVGITWPIGLADIDVAYTYTLTEGLSLPGRGPNVSFTFDKRMKTHSVTAGVIYRF